MSKKTRVITDIVYIPRQGLSHFTEMVEWLKNNIGPGNFNYGGYGLWTTKKIIPYSISTIKNQRSCLNLFTVVHQMWSEKNNMSIEQEFNLEVAKLNKIAHNLIAPMPDRIISLCRLYELYKGDVKQQSIIVKRIESVVREV